MHRRFFSRIIIATILIVGFQLSVAAQSKNKKPDLFAKKNLIAWCIVPFDNQHRTPAQRVDMLKRLGFTQYAYDWRHEHVPTFAEEISLAKKAGIKIAAVWMWIDKNSDRVGQLSEDNEEVLKIIKDSGLKTRLWVGFNNNFYADEADDSKVTKGADMLNYLRERAGSFVDGIGLYNHGDWFGEPENEIMILKKLNHPIFGMVYSFHHGHHQIDAFPSLLDKMKPWLWTVNINGMKKAGPQILTVGSGDSELDMLKAVKASGFNGTIGILGHIDTEDVEQVLKRNMDGLEKLQLAMNSGQ